MNKQTGILDADGRIAATLRCIGCGYNLRTLARDGVCPECGLAVERSLAGSPLRFADAVWLRAVARGVGLLRVAAWAYLVAAATLAAFAAFQFLSWGINLSLDLFLVLSAVAAVAGYFASLIGTFFLTRRDAGRLTRSLSPEAERIKGAALLPFFAVSISLGLGRLPGMAIAALLPAVVALPWFLTHGYFNALFAGDARVGEFKASAAGHAALRLAMILNGVFAVGVLLLSASGPRSGPRPSPLFELIPLVIGLVAGILYLAATFLGAIGLGAYHRRLQSLVADARAEDKHDQP